MPPKVGTPPTLARENRLRSPLCSRFLPPRAPRGGKKREQSRESEWGGLRRRARVACSRMLRASGATGCCSGSPGRRARARRRSPSGSSRRWRRTAGSAPRTCRWTASTSPTSRSTALGRRDRKGAIDTFDGWGYRALLQRLRDRADEPVYAPGFERVLEQPIAGSIAVGPEVDLVVSEGNYLLVDDGAVDGRGRPLRRGLVLGRARRPPPRAADRPARRVRQGRLRRRRPGSRRSTCRTRP